MSVQSKAQEGLVAAIETACGRSTHRLAIRRAEVLALGEAVSFGESFLGSMAGQATGQRTFRVDSLQLLDLDSDRGEVHVVVPWSGVLPMPHELWSVVAWHLPWTVVLKQEVGGLLRKWVWEEGPGAATDELSKALSALGKVMDGGIPTTVSAGDATVEIEWGYQAVPLDEGRYVFAAQSGPRFLGAAIDLDGFLDRRARFEETLASIPVSGPAKFGFVFPCHAETFVKRAYPEVVQRRIDGRILGLIETGQRLLEAGKFLQASRSAQDALSIAPGDPGATALLEESRRRHAEGEALAAQARDAVRKKDFETAAGANQRLLALFAGDKARSREIRAALDQVDAERVRHHFQQATVLSKQGRAPEAADHLRRLLELKPNHQAARQLLATLGH